MLRATEAQEICCAWLRRFFKICGDCIPNEPGKVKLNINTIKDVYDQYEAAITLANLDKVDYSAFTTMWSNLFPYCLARNVVDIPGKCNTCFLIDNLQRTTKGSEMLTALTFAHILHRGGLIMPERAQ